MADRIGQQLGNYRLTRLLGQGGFAEVYLGEHMYLKTQAAVKVLSTQLAREDVEDFQAEARTVANLEHPHIVRVLEFGIEGAMPFLVMSYAPNGSLRQQHPRGTPLPLPLILRYVRQVADALQYAHDEKLIHRDIKPENMLLGRRKEVLLSDFGIAIISQTSRSKSVQEVIGTVAYMSPEMLQGKPKAASDQYALGIVVYEWLCGQRPFQGGFTELASQHMFVLPPSLREKNPTISPNLEQVVMTALAKEPQQRFSSVHAFAHALEQAGQSAASQPTVYAPPAQPFQPTQPATPPNSPRQPAVPPAQNRFPQPLAGTATTSQAISSPMLNIPSSPAGAAYAETVLPQPSSSLPPTVLAAPAIATPTDIKTPPAHTLEPTVAASPSPQTPPSTARMQQSSGSSSSPRLFQLSGWALVVSSVIGIAQTFVDTSLFLSETILGILWWKLDTLLLVAATILLLSGLPGLHVKQSNRAGLLGIIGIAIIFASSFGFIVLNLLLFLPTINFGQYDGLSNVSTLLSIIGYILLGTMIVRASVFPRWTGIVLILTSIVQVLSFTPVSTALNHTFYTIVNASANVLPFWVAVAVCGYTLLSRQKVLAA